MKLLLMGKAEVSSVDATIKVVNSPSQKGKEKQPLGSAGWDFCRKVNSSRRVIILYYSFVVYNKSW